MALQIDLTLLKADATEADVKKTCSAARAKDFIAVCVNPSRVALAKISLAGSGVLVCTVIGFPLGAAPAKAKVAELECALADGADEFDVVMNVGLFKDGKDNEVLAELKELVSAAKGRTVKVIIEAGLLSNEEIVRATRLVEGSGAAFVKSSTGYPGLPPATPELVRLMKSAAPKIKVKASGGVGTKAQYNALIAAGADRVGTSAAAGWFT